MTRWPRAIAALGLGALSVALFAAAGAVARLAAWVWPGHVFGSLAPPPTARRAHEPTTPPEVSNAPVERPPDAPERVPTAEEFAAVAAHTGRTAIRVAPDRAVLGPVADLKTRH